MTRHKHGTNLSHNRGFCDHTSDLPFHRLIACFTILELHGSFTISDVKNPGTLYLVSAPSEGSVNPGEQRRERLSVSMKTRMRMATARNLYLFVIDRPSQNLYNQAVSPSQQADIKGRWLKR